MTDPGADLYALVTYVHEQCNSDLLDAITTSRLTFSQLRILHYLAHSQIPPTVKRCAFVLGVRSASMSKIAEELDRQALVDRITDERDQRVKRLAITPRGRDRIAQLSAARLDTIRAIAGELEPDEIEAVAVLCRRPEIAKLRPADAA